MLCLQITGRSGRTNGTTIRTRATGKCGHSTGFWPAEYNPECLGSYVKSYSWDKEKAKKYKHGSKGGHQKHYKHGEKKDYW